MAISIVDVVTFKYPGQFESGNIGFYTNDQVTGNIDIQLWNVANITQPTIQSLVDLIPSYQKQYDLTILENQITQSISLLLNKVAAQKQYETAISCVSYINSTVAQYKNEATIFIAWRDSVWSYTFNILAQVQANTLPAPTFTAFMAELPLIIWSD